MITDGQFREMQSEIQELRRVVATFTNPRPVEFARPGNQAGCQKWLMRQGKFYSRTCPTCGLGPCHFTAISQQPDAPAEDDGDGAMATTFRKPARPVDRVFIHCTASDNESLAGNDLVAAVDAWHMARGWAGVGYHYLIDKAGNVLAGRSLEKTPAAQAGHNTGTIAICVHGLALEKFTPAALSVLKDFCEKINLAYAVPVSSDGVQGYDLGVTFHGHCEVSSKTCPVFDYRTLLGLDDKGRMPL